MTQKSGSGITSLAVNLGTVNGWSAPRSSRLTATKSFRVTVWMRPDGTQIEAELWRREHLTLRGFEFRFPGGMVCRLVTTVTEIFLRLCRSIPQNRIKSFCSLVPIWTCVGGACRMVVQTLKSSLATGCELNNWRSPSSTVLIRKVRVSDTVEHYPPFAWRHSLFRLS